jgi:hypothetical protein
MPYVPEEVPQVPQEVPGNLQEAPQVQQEVFKVHDKVHQKQIIILLLPASGEERRSVS